MDFYLRNPLLKKVNVALEYTPAQVAEYIKCKEDFVYFINNYVKIITLDEGLRNFALYPYQEKFLGLMHQHRFTMSMMPRQMGKTQTVAAYVAWILMFRNEQTIAILANRAAGAREIISRIKIMIENLPLWLQQGVTEWNKGSISFENKSRAFAGATTSSSIRGQTCSIVVIDEAAIISNTMAEEFFTSTYPVISSGSSSKIIMMSTPRGPNHFWKMWTDAEAGRNDFKTLRVHYYEHPKRDEEWAKEQKRLLGDLKYSQEVLCEWIGSSATLISPAKLNQLVPHAAEYRKEFDDGGGEINVYEAPVPEALYVLCADTAEGVGKDYSSFSIIRVDTEVMQQVCTLYTNRTSPMVFPSFIQKWATYYNNAYVLMEINKFPQVAYILHEEYGYENIITIYKTPKGQALSGQGASSYFQTRLGLVMDKRVKKQGCSSLKDLVDEGKLVITDTKTIKELLSFIYHQNKNSYAADDGETDDLVMTLVMFAWLSNSDYFKDITNKDIRKLIHERRLQAIEEETLPIGFFVDGTEEESKEKWIDIPANFSY